MSSQGVRIIKPLEEDFVPNPSDFFLAKKTPPQPALLFSIVFALISVALAAIVFTQAHF